MDEPDDQQIVKHRRWIDDWGSAVAIAFAIIICLAAFIWLYVELDPWMSDFTGSDAIVTPGADELLTPGVDDAGGEATATAP